MNLSGVNVENIPFRKRTGTYLIYNHYSGWMFIQWDRHEERWIDIHRVQTVEPEHILQGYKLPKKPPKPGNKGNKVE